MGNDKLERLKQLNEEQIKENEENFINREKDQKTDNQPKPEEAAEMTYEDYFRENPYRKEKMSNLQLPETIQRKLKLIKQLRNVHMSDFVSNILEDWFAKHSDEVKRDYNQLKKLL